MVCSAAAALLVAALGAGCGSSPPTDKNFGTDLGADFRAPITDAGRCRIGDTNVTPEASVDGTGAGGTTSVGGTTGTGGTTSTGTAGSGGTTGAADGAAGNAGTAGAGS